MKFIIFSLFNVFTLVSSFANHNIGATYFDMNEKYIVDKLAHTMSTDMEVLSHLSTIFEIYVVKSLVADASMKDSDLKEFQEIINLKFEKLKVQQISINKRYPEFLGLSKKSKFLLYESIYFNNPKKIFKCVMTVTSTLLECLGVSGGLETAFVYFCLGSSGAATIATAFATDGISGVFAAEEMTGLATACLAAAGITVTAACITSYKDSLADECF